MALRILLLVAITWVVGGCTTSVFAQAVVGTGRIIGQVTDTSGGVLPGVRIIVSGPNLHQEAITDADGRFDVEALVQGRPSTYTITAELPGFESIKIENMTVNVGSDVHVPVTLKVGRLCQIHWVDHGWAESLRLADLVVLVRIESSTSNRPPDLPDYCAYSTEYVAIVIDTIKDTNRSSLKNVRFFAIVGADDVHASASEYIAFLRWDESIRKFAAPNPRYLIPVEAGWVRWTGLNTLGLPDSTPVSAVLDALRSLGAQR